MDELPDTPQSMGQRTQKVGDVQFTTTAKGQPVDSKITSLDFDDSGDWLVAASDDEQMHIFDIKEGKRTKSVASKKYGVHLARFTHHSRQILYASTKGDDSLRLLELHSESFVRYFGAHQSQVTSLALSPSNDTFVSCSKDDTVCLWDLASRNPQGKLKLSTPYLAAYDPSAFVLAIASQSTSSILLYDVRNYDKAPFTTFDMSPHEDRYTSQSKGRGWTKLEFSNDGKSLLLGTDYRGHFLMDAFDGRLKSFLVGRSGSSGRAAPVSSSSKPLGQGDACFTPDGRFILGGSGEDPDTLVWDVAQSGDAGSYVQPTAKLRGRERVAVIECNPRYNMVATGDNKVAMWLPSESKD
ncbi:MAG: hypothetical protein Q9227_008418 [Pyrenula ochraceoflavens]